jgi:hypothetical protein
MRTQSQLQQLTQNNRTIFENVQNGLKAWNTRRKRMIETAKKNGANVDELILNYLRTHTEYYSDCSKFGILSRELGKISYESFYRFGDRNIIDREIRQNYLSRMGSSLDLIVMDLSDRYFFEITTDDAIEFIVQFPNPEDYHIELSEAIKEFYIQVGFNIDFKFANQYLNEQCSIEAFDNCPF